MVRFQARQALLIQDLLNLNCPVGCRTSPYKARTKESLHAWRSHRYNQATVCHSQSIGATWSACGCQVCPGSFPTWPHSLITAIHNGRRMVELTPVPNLIWHSVKSLSLAMVAVVRKLPPRFKALTLGACCTGTAATATAGRGADWYQYLHSR